MTHIAHNTLINKKDESFIDADWPYHSEYLWNSYEDKDAQKRWDDACKILDESPEVQELKELFKKYCECEFKGFKYLWWDDKLNSWDVDNIFGNRRKNVINHKFWHECNWKDPRTGWTHHEGYDHFAAFGSIDHQSLDEHYLYPEIKAIGYETYLFSSDIMVIIDNDNH